ncbi:hypothetical protein CsSME_00028381 [Camellia sinensis var. sinensis]
MSVLVDESDQLLYYQSMNLLVLLLYNETGVDLEARRTKEASLPLSSGLKGGMQGGLEQTSEDCGSRGDDHLMDLCGPIKSLSGNELARPGINLEVVFGKAHIVDVGIGPALINEVCDNPIWLEASGVQ